MGTAIGDEPGDGGEADHGDAVLAVDSVGRSFGSVDALEDVSFAVARGSLTAIVGPNGSGKTTLVRIAAGLDDPDSGRVTVRMGAERPIGYLPQEPGFRPSLTVEETLAFYADLLPDADPEAAMDRVGLLGVRDRRVDALSGGMRRLLGLAQGLLGSPPILILDEPTSGLDPRMTRQIFDVAETLVDAGTTVLVTSHDLTYAAEADDVVVVHRGRAIAHDAPRELCERTNTESLADAVLSMVGTDPVAQSGTE